ncbi:MAG: 1-acyl-sn-glycerol-3-phosphate acyltransferase [bacterium]
MRLPPRLVRRVVFAPLGLALALVAVPLLPVAALIAALSSRLVPGRHRPLRVLWFGFVYLALEAVVLVAAFGLWLASGFGYVIRSERFVSAHYRLLGWFLARVIGTARRTFNITLDIRESGEHATAAPRLVLSRHAGPGDSFLLVHTVCERKRRPRIVLKDTFQWEPMFDTILGRLPCQFVSPNPRPGAGDQLIEGIGRIAGGMGERDSLVIFPEGGNITEARRLRSIGKLEERGRHEEAERARTMRNVMAPRPGGALAALDACPAAEVVFVAHTGLEDLSSAVDLWRGLPMDSAVRVRTWYLTPDQVPAEREERIRWLFDWWKRVDTWIENTRTEDLEF